MGKPLIILATASDYRPSHGGIATFAYELLTSLAQLPDVEIHLLARPIPEQMDWVDPQDVFKTTRLPLSKTSSLASLQLARAILRECESRNVDAILNFVWLPDGTASWIAKATNRDLSIPYFNFAHGVEVMETSRNLKKRIRSLLAPLKKTVFQKAAATFAVSQFTCDLLRDNCDRKPEKIRLTYLGVDTDVFKPTEKNLSLEKKYNLEGKKIFLTLSRLEDYKGVDRALGALRRVIEKHPDLVYIIAGEGPDRKRLENLSREYHLEKNVRFTGALPYSELVHFYNLCDCFVLLSRTDTHTPNVEGFGIVILEAAACEKPTLGGKSGGIVDAIQDNYSGWWVDPNDEKAIAEKMLLCLENPELTRRLGRQARERAKEKFSWDQVAARVLDEVKRHVRN